MKNTNTKFQTLDIIRTIKDDLAYKYSVEHNDVFNLVLVLRAWGFDYSNETARNVLELSDKVVA